MSTLKKYLTPPTLLETPDYVNRAEPLASRLTKELGRDFNRSRELSHASAMLFLSLSNSRSCCINQGKSCSE